MKQNPITFESEIKKHDNINAGFIEFPFDTYELFGKKGQVKVKVLFDNQISYRGSLAKMKSTCHTLGITQVTVAQLLFFRK